MLKQKNYFILLIVILMLAIVLRMRLLDAITYVSADQCMYLDFAKNIQETGSFQSNIHRNRPSHTQYLHPAQTFKPLFILLISISFKIFGVSIKSGLLIPLLSGILLCYPLFYITKTLFSKKEGLLVIGIWAVNIPLFKYSLIILSETTALLFTFLSLLFFIKKKSFLSGLFLGITSLTRLDYSIVLSLTLLIPVFTSAINKEIKKDFIKKYFIIFFIAIIIFTPWLIRNYKIYKEPVYVGESYNLVTQNIIQITQVDNFGILLSIIISHIKLIIDGLGLFICFFWGGFFGKSNKSNSLYWLILINILFHSITHLHFADTRFILLSITSLLILASRGITILINKIIQIFELNLPITYRQYIGFVLIILIFLYPINNFHNYYKNAKNWFELSSSQKKCFYSDFSDFLVKNTHENSIFITGSHSEIAWYSNRTTIDISLFKNIDEIRKVCEKYPETYMVIDSNMIASTPFLISFLDNEEKKHQGFKLLSTFICEKQVNKKNNLNLTTRLYIYE